ncbi:MAG TPA: YncE family protein [Elusimicrobiota bacterium]|nr:YncE family protein [Elusimicrobiota bacterium]
MKKMALIGVSVLTAGLLLGRSEAASYAVSRSAPVPGDGGWDLLACDAQARRLYVSHSEQTQVLDIDALKVVGSIAETHGVHGIALAPDLGRGYISAGKDNQVVVFDLKSLKILSRVRAGTNPDVVVYDPATLRVFAFNGRSQDVTVMDAKTFQAVVTLPLGGKPEFAVADGRGKLFVNLEDKSQLLEVNTRALAITNRWPLAPCEEPSALAMDASSGRLFAACGNKTLVVVNGADGKVVAQLPIGDHVDGAVFDASTKRVFSSNGDGTITVIQEDSPDAYRVIQTVPTQPGARTIALDPSTGRLFLPVAKLGPPPAPTARQPRPRPSIVPATFQILVVSPS